MKSLNSMITFSLVFCLVFCFYFCQKTEMVTEAFEAQFTGTYMYFGPDTVLTPKCADSEMTYRIIVDCIGTSNVMGDIDAHFDFCANEQGDYGNLYGFFTDQDGDTLFLSSEGMTGKVINGRLEEHPDFVTSYWRDEFVFSGGTGKYEGATGKGMGDDYNSSEDPNSHHNWKGTITLKK